MTAICQLSATMKITVRTTFAKFPTIAGRMSRKSPVTSLASLITLVISEPVVRFVKNRMDRFLSEAKMSLFMLRTTLGTILATMTFCRMVSSRLRILTAAKAIHMSTSSEKKSPFARLQKPVKSDFFPSTSSK